MKEEDLNYVSFQDYFWIKFDENYISLGGKFLPTSEIHMTFSFNPNSPDYNFHLTRNVEHEDGKPKIEIFRIEKELLNKTMENSYSVLLGNMLEPIDQEELDFAENHSSYVPFEKVEKVTRDVMVNSFTEGEYKIEKKTRLKLKADLEAKITEFSTRADLADVFNTHKVSPSSVTTLVEGGVMMLGDRSFPGLFIQGRWYKIRDSNKFSDLFRNIIDDETMVRIKWHYGRSLIRLQTAVSWKDTELNSKRSIYLVRHDDPRK